MMRRTFVFKKNIKYDLSCNNITRTRNEKMVYIHCNSLSKHFYKTNILCPSCALIKTSYFLLFVKA